MAQIDTPIPSLKLNDGTSLPMLAYGTGTAWYKSGDDGKTDQTLVDAVKTAIGMGYHHLDCAQVYNTETEVGTAIKESGIPREKLFITTKEQSGLDDIQAAIKRSLEKLQLDYVDLYLIHSPFPFKDGKDTAGIQRAWAEMEKVKEAGLAKSIGVSNFYPQHMEALLATAKVAPSINQVEFHPYLQHEKMIAMHKQHKIATAAYAPQTPVTKASPGPLDGYLAALAKKYAVSPGEICLRYCIDQDVVAVTTSSKEQRLSDYLRCTRFKLTPKELEEISQLGSEKHFRGFWGNYFAEDDRS